MTQLVQEGDVAGYVDDQRGEPEPRQHRVRRSDEHSRGRRHRLRVRAPSDDLLAVIEHVDAGLMAVLQGAHEAFLVALQLFEAHPGVQRAVKDGRELDALGRPLLARHHPRGGVAVAVTARPVQPAGAQRVAGGEPQRELVAGPHDPALLVDDPRPVGRRQDLKRRVGQQLALAVDLDMPDRVQKRLITGGGLEVQGGEHAWRELREMRMAGGERVTALLFDAPRETARVLRGGTQSRFADLADGARDGILAALDRVDEDPRERLAQLRVIVARSCGLLPLLRHGEAGVALGVLDRAGVQVDQLVAALDEHLRAERQQHRQGAATRRAGRAPTPAGAGHRRRASARGRAAASTSQYRPRRAP